LQAVDRCEKNRSCAETPQRAAMLLLPVDDTLGKTNESSEKREKPDEKKQHCQSHHSPGPSSQGTMTASPPLALFFEGSPFP
jgi:hypothetical protein